MAKAIKACRVAGCNRPTNGPHGRGALGMCGRHYQRYRKHGDPEGGRTAEGVPMEWLQQHASFDGEECLAWPFGRGRGNVSVGGKSTPPARAMCLLAYGPPPTPSHQAAHSCGRGEDGCVNPKHLRWATVSENHNDKNAHGTMLRGHSHPRAKLSVDQVVWIKKTYGSATIAEMARALGVSHSAVSGIVKGRKWTHV